MPVPPGYFEGMPPVGIMRQGSGYVGMFGGATEPSAPGFIRFVHAPTDWSNHWANFLELYPRSVTYGGPITRASMPMAERIVAVWVATYFPMHKVAAEFVPILPSMGPATWPGTGFQWSGAFESSPPDRYQLVWPDPIHAPTVERAVPSTVALLERTVPAEVGLALHRKWECLECGNVLETSAPSPAPSNRCPVCGGLDTAAPVEDGTPFPWTLAALGAVFLFIGAAST